MDKLKFITFDEKLEAAWGLHKTANEHLKRRIDELTAENEHLKDMIKLYDEMVAALLPSWETEPDSDEKTQYMITYTAIKKALG